uniref:Serine aminopeptidase S33 domain-containing protein n=1 Tax=Chromera velia CCMP2878 TaxID=1169474 RepID=A0A0G4FYK9_9ALVE|eukprot:Cvel_19389.t1-p1 / transcript=Cvel_19389.t1 / gene=Cvel_19389 / organism=Chromera_velia_CCMP2878 / gene_product=Monoglyceride lipase, putative / transcript_product=Monoglyceride lipase, putative / location=Cvel_scaffold1668:1995-6644(+) / protein_length=312 / sequence_SO=supercontig / SO=protein_coding / is_pseudo=false
MGCAESTVVPTYDAGDPEECTFTNKKDLKITYWAWKASEKPKAYLIGLHGICSHARQEWMSFPGQKYEGGWAQKIPQENISFFGIDHQSHGVSEGWKGYRCAFESFDDLVDDAQQLLSIVAEKRKNENPSAPIFVMGLSMGGCVAALLAERDLPDLSGTILLAPMLALEEVKKKPVNKILLPISSMISALTPNLAVAAGKEPNLQFPDLEAEVEKDPLFYNGLVRARVARECLRVVDVVQQAAPKLTKPLIIFHAKSDTQCEPDGSRFLMTNALNCPDKTLNELEYGFHMLAGEPDNEKTLGEIVSWIESHL